MNFLSTLFDLSLITTWFINHAFSIALILLFGLMAQEVLRIVSGRIRTNLARASDGAMRERKARAKSIASVVFTSISIIIWLVVVLALLQQFGLDIGPLLASAGLVGLAVSFGSQELVKDVITGFFFLLENQFNTGDVIQIQDKVGVVKEISLRTVTIEEIESKTIHIIRNSQIGVLSRMAPPEIKKEAANA